MIFQNHYNREESVAKAEQMFAHLDEDGNGDLTEVGTMYCQAQFQLASQVTS